MNQKSKLTFGKILERFSYGCGDFGCNIIYTAMSAFLLFYYTDYANVSAIAVGTIMMVSRIFDGISDIIMGVIVDRTKSKYGKARPWILRMCIPFAISGILLFSVPASWASTPKLVYVFITYNLVSTVIYTAINVPYSALNALMTQDPYERSVLSIFRNLLATAGTLTINTFTLPLVEHFGNNAAAWTKTFIVFGFVAIVAFLFTFFGTKERVRASENSGETKAEDVPFVTGIKALFKNKYWIMMTGMLALFFLMYSVMDVQNRYAPADPELAKGSAPITMEFLRKFYLEAYDRISTYMPKEKYVVLHDGFELMAWKDFMQEEKYSNVILDTHQYLMVAEARGCSQTIEGYLKYVREELEPQITEMEKYFPVICGEWCLFNSLACGCDTKGGQSVLNGVEGSERESLSTEEKKEIYATLAKAQLELWDKCSGYFYWSYKLLTDTVNTPGWIGWDSWDLGRCVDFGWFPAGKGEK